MAMIEIEVNDEAVVAQIERALNRTSDLTPLMQNIGEHLVATTKARFKEGRAPDGSKWAPKSQATLEAYGIRKSNSVDIRPLFGPTKLLSSQIFIEADSTGVSVGSNRIYSAVMQFGASKGEFGTASNGSPVPWGNIPARPYLGLSEQDRGWILETVEDWLRESLDA
jgi:phage virion morphogenesis protein